VGVKGFERPGESRRSESGRGQELHRPAERVMEKNFERGANKERKIGQKKEQQGEKITPSSSKPGIEYSPREISGKRQKGKNSKS